MSSAHRFAFGCLVILSLLMGRLPQVPATAAENESAKEAAAANVEKDVTQGALRIVQKDGGLVECPLKHTDVQADVAGFIARVKVTQTFQNPTQEKIEAVYVFPLPHEAAVDDMTMVIGERKIVGQIKRRAEARSIYEQALLAGQTAALLEQERPNIFTQSVGNIEPGQEVKIEISYVDVLRYDLGTYQFQFPMVVGPRYIPGTPSGGGQPTPAELQGKVSPPVANTDRVPDAERISPPVLKPGVRNGHDISLSLKLAAGVPIQDLVSTNHRAEITKAGDRGATVKLSPADTLPNKDFVLRYGVVGKKPEMAVLGHTGDYSADRQKLGNGYFMLMIQPQEDERLTKSPPREIVFLCDVSGSMSGQPTAKVVEAMQGMLKLCRKEDTVQVITFANQAQKLFDAPVPVNDENIAKALGFTAGLQGRGGTEMLKGVQMAIEEPIDKQRLRIVVMLTDGYIGNEAEIIEHVGKHCGDQIRFWCIGIGSSPNMFLVDGVAKQGGGMGKNLGLEDQAQPLAQEIMTRIQRAQLARIKIDWGNLKVSETYPAKIPELWAGRPVIVYGRYAQPDIVDEAVIVENITVRGNVEGEDVSWPLRVELPMRQETHDVLAKVWARQKIEDLMHQAYYQTSPAVEEMVTAIALDYKLMSQYTSFVAVDESKKAETSEPAKLPRRMLVPVPLPDGTRWEGFFGEGGEADEFALGDNFLSFKLDKQLERLAKSEPSVALRAKRTNRPALQQLSLRRGGSMPAAGFAPAGLMPATRGLTRLADARFGALGGFGGAAGGAHRGRRMPGLDGLNRSSLGTIAQLGVAEEKIIADFEFRSDAEFGFAMLAAGGEKHAEAARKLLETAAGKEAPTDRQKLRFLLLQACLLDTAAVNAGRSDGSVAAQAIERLEKLHADQVKAWSDELPGLKTKLNLVLRDVSLSEALAQVAKAAKIDISLVEGSVADADALLGGDEPRVSYLDLRRATVAQALDWILSPARLAWRPEGKAIVAASDRRREGDSGWVYDVSAIASPLEAELARLDDEAKRAAVQRAVEELIAAVRKALGADDETSVVWFAPGELLVFGSAERHAAMAKAIATLQSGKARPAGALDKLSEVTRKRFAARQEDRAKAQAARRKLDVALSHDHFSWQLLAGAAGGELDLEALTELQIAWQSGRTAELLDSPARPLILRSLWAVCAAADQLPTDKELAALAISAREQSQSAIQAAIGDLEKNRGDRAALVGSLYGALANQNDKDYHAALVRLLPANSDNDAAASELRLLARLLVSEPTDADRQSLAALLTRGVGGADAVVLAAMASQRAGLAEEFRAESHDLLGKQPLPGEVVVLVNRLSLPGVKLARAAK